MAVLAALAVGSTAVAASTASAPSCQQRCFVDVSADRFKPVGAGASGATLTMTVGATVRWRLKGSSAHSVVADSGLFRFGSFADEKDLSFVLAPSAGRYDYRDTVGGAGAGTLLVLPRFTRLPDGALQVTWGAPGDVPADRVHQVRWLLVQGAEVLQQGTWYRADAVGSRVLRPQARLKSAAALRAGRSLCVEVRTARGEPRRWSDWANACAAV
jgi:plastocyanin